MTTTASSPANQITEKSINAALAQMGEGKWITYLPTANIVTGVHSLLLQQNYIVQLFGKAIYPYERDDNNITILPAMSIYRAMPAISEKQIGRTGAINGNINIDLYFPGSLDREKARNIFDTIYEVLGLFLQQESFYEGLHEYLVPLPDTKSPVYDDVYNWRETNGSWLFGFANELNFTKPTIKKLSTNEDVWYGAMQVSFMVSKQTWLEFLQAVGINFAYNPNEVIYGNIEQFNTETSIQMGDNDETQIIEGEF
jgi:hypothetical protein